ncbi:MAG: hypothetical protein ACRENS_03685, partial [Candidatus Eiseniibacteriota bacterium]
MKLTTRSHLHLSSSSPALYGSLAVALLVGLLAPRAFGYEVETHRALSNVALRHSGCVVSSYLKTQLRLPDSIMTAVPGGTLSSRLEDGADHEDTEWPTRPRHHFFNPITKSGLADIFWGTPSLQWAYEDPLNHWSWRDARNAYQSSFTSGTPAQRAQALGDAFFALGHVIHLVQDLAQPQHTRNDAHLSGLPGSPYERYCQINYASPYVVSLLPPVSAPSFMGAPTLFDAIPGEFSGFWDTGQYHGQADFSVFGATPGLAEYSNAYFITDDTMFGTWTVGFLRRPGMPGLRVGMINQLPNSSDSRRHAWPHPALQNTDLASFFPASTTRVSLARAGDGLTGVTHYVSLQVHDANGSVVRSMPNLFLIDAAGRIGFNDVTYRQYALDLLPMAAAYSAGMLNYFFRGQFDIEVRWQEDAQQYRVTVTNRSGETMRAGDFDIYQDDASGNRIHIAGPFDSGTIVDGGTFDCSFAAHQLTGPYTMVFNGTLGNELFLAVVAKTFEIVRVHITWTPNSDQDLQMWGPDGSLIWWNNKITDYGELDNDDFGGLGPENITLKDLLAGRYEFLIDYYRDWWKESYYDPGTALCLPYVPPVNTPDDTPEYDPCFTQTPITVTMNTFHNSLAAVRTVTRTMNYPDYDAGIFLPGNPEGPVGESWYVTQIVTV